VEIRPNEVCDREEWKKRKQLVGQRMRRKIGEEEMEIDHRKIETMVPKRFHRWLKVFRKVESERMPVRKV